MRIRYVAILTLLVFCSTTNSETVNDRYMLFAGHSFFHPVASKLEYATKVLGVQGHGQQVIVAGGKTGSPEALWFGDYADQIKRVLDSGEVDLLGLTFYDEKSGQFEDYQRWVDYALAQNPDTSFFIGLPWGNYPATKTLSEYVAEIKHFEQLLLGVIGRLEADYPDTEFLFLNYGRGAAELRRMVEVGELPGNVLSGDRKSAIYTDDIGHAGNLLAELVMWLWIPVLFENVDFSGSAISDRPMAKLALKLRAQ